jgi:hypothetical protein
VQTAEDTSLAVLTEFFLKSGGGYKVEVKIYIIGKYRKYSR